MIKSKNVATESGHSSLFVLAVAAIMICSSFVLGAAALAPAAAEDSATTYATADNGATDDFPAQFVNQGVEIELMMEMCD
jgi:hypothetical protein